MKISIFAKNSFLNTNRNVPFLPTDKRPASGYLRRVSSIIRGYQIAEKIDAKLNPKSGYKKDICIYVKPELDAKGDVKFEGKSVYLDVVDELNYVPVLKKHPKVTAIVVSERDYISLATEGITNKIVLIPQHHCNFDREIRTREKITTVGIIGNSRAFTYLPPDLKPRLLERGIELLTFSEFFTRQDVVNFYKKIDVQIVWRPYKKKLANPLKIVNAASFGIPTIALDEIYFKDMGNCYIGVENLNHFFIELDRLIATPRRYEAFANLALKKAEDYHIEKIAKLYKALD